MRRSDGWTRPRRSLLATLAGLALVFCAAACRGEAAIPAPAWLERTAVADKMIVNGLPSTVHHFQADRRLEELLDFYRNRWAAPATGKSGYREAEVAPWHVISRLDGRYLLTVQVKARGASACEGYLAVADLQEADAGKKRGRDFPRLEGSDILSDLTSYDPGRKGRTVLVVNDHSVSRNRGFYRDYYLDHGWRQAVDQEAEGGAVMVFAKNGSETHLVISTAHGRTQVVMNLVDSI